jgi:hypothetical protein
MPRYGTTTQKNARDLFENKDYERMEYEGVSFDIKADDKNEKQIIGKDVVEEMEEIMRTLCAMIEDLEEYEDEDETYLIFDMGEYYVGNYQLGEHKTWIYEYEINEYYDTIERKLNEYYCLVKVIEDEKAKIQLEKDICLGVALAFMRA